MTHPLQTLHDKVEAGEEWPPLYSDGGAHMVDLIDAALGITGGSWEARENVTKAYRGSLDAAKALHDAVLPGWQAQIETDGEVTVSSFTTNEYGFSVVDTEITVQDNCMARSWLLAILRALIEEFETDG